MGPKTVVALSLQQAMLICPNLRKRPRSYQGTFSKLTLGQHRAEYMTLNPRCMESISPYNKVPSDLSYLEK